MERWEEVGFGASTLATADAGSTDSRSRTSIRSVATSLTSACDPGQQSPSIIPRSDPIMRGITMLPAGAWGILLRSRPREHIRTRRGGVGRRACEAAERGGGGGGIENVESMAFARRLKGFNRASREEVNDDGHRTGQPAAPPLGAREPWWRLTAPAKGCWATGGFLVPSFLQSSPFHHRAANAREPRAPLASV